MNRIYLSMLVLLFVGCGESNQQGSIHDKVFDVTIKNEIKDRLSLFFDQYDLSESDEAFLVNQVYRISLAIDETSDSSDEGRLFSMRELMERKLLKDVKEKFGESFAEKFMSFLNENKVIDDTMKMFDD
ncbi:hypothetical protein [Rubellicoccus peritrichatus]|uniref:Uncharacterized protein n=1 Tax=Rubellicoccus peritrichatus TaxID=3080537 RepID=A0AAQ3QXN4_9BACT|nr:hypothetical protein [Puniceicoccus sp. CR14]WOO43035.1 hypothetical protein RZN69_08010 [Puniceicoccus sp. CR14]